MGFPGGVSGKYPACQCRRHRRCGFNPSVRKTPLEGDHCNPLWYSCLENPMDRRAWRAIVHRVAKSQTRLKRLSTGKNKWECHYLCDQGCKDSNRMGLIFLVLTWLHMCKTKNKKQKTVLKPSSYSTVHSRLAIFNFIVLIWLTCHVTAPSNTGNVIFKKPIIKVNC